MDTISSAVAGFSAVSAVLLFCTYALLLDVQGKSAYSVISCGVLLAALACIQMVHLRYFGGGAQPLDLFPYRLALFVVPSSFYFFGYWAINPTAPFRPLALLHLLPILLLFVLPLQVALPILLTFGAGYSVWLGYLVYGLRAQRKQFRFALFYFSVMSLIGVSVLILGFAIPFIDDAIFYYFYNNAIGVAFAIMIVALLASPELIADLAEAARVRYGTSTLRDVDVDTCLKRLRELMTVSKVYQSEDLSLASLADQLGISSHQLSELVNTRLGMGFSKYVRDCRLAAAKVLLVSAPAQSILSISMQTGFRSQSAFYAAFKEATGLSPGDYRKAQLRNDHSGTP
ncbi:MAG TPA: helix-turn-helix domain-containing protein [Steroidobacteraceae bacterium]|nr:helix-turn-helix domain-containing protein [Steroidobacteraceae bacterium]